jgi:hypothetical protein
MSDQALRDQIKALKAELAAHQNFSRCTFVCLATLFENAGRNSRDVFRRDPHDLQRAIDGMFARISQEARKLS